MNEHEWALGDDTVQELYVYTNLGVHISDKMRKKAGMIFSFNVDCRKTNPLIYIDKMRKKAGMIFSFNVDRRKTNPLIYVKFWR